MENGLSGKEETKDGASRQDFNNSNRTKTDEEVIQELTAFFTNMFQYENLLNNSYLVHRTNISFDIEIRYIYEEFTVKAITSDTKLINKALEATDNIIIKKKGDEIETIRPKKNTLRIILRINHLNKSDSDELKQVAFSYVESADISKWDYNISIGILTVVCRTEKAAQTLFDKFRENPFKGNQLEVQLSDEGLFISASENVTNKKKGGFGNRGGFMPYPMYNPYQFMYPPQMYGMPMNGGGYSGGYSKGYNKRGKFGGGKRGGGKYPRGGNRDNKANFEMNEQEFPELGKGGNEE